MNEIKKIGMYSTDEILEFMTEGEGQGFLGRSMFDAMYFKINDLQSKIDEAIEYINKEYDTEPHELYGLVSADELLNILNDDKIQEIPQFKGTMEQLDNLCDIRKE